MSAIVRVLTTGGRRTSSVSCRRCRSYGTSVYTRRRTEAHMSKPGDQNAAADGQERTVDLLERARAGDRAALDELFARHTSLLRRWAARRLPQWARLGTDTVDLVQDTMLGLFRNLEGFKPRGEGALQAYLRQGLVNRVRSQIRNANVRPAFVGVDPQVATTSRRRSRSRSAGSRWRPTNRPSRVCPRRCARRSSHASSWA